MMNKKSRIIILIVALILLSALFISIKPYKQKKAFQANEKGMLQYTEENYQAARLSFEKAIKLNPELISAYINLAKTHLALNDVDLALDKAAIVLEIEENNIEALTISGQAKLKKNDFNIALDLFNEAIAIDSSMATAYYYRGIAKANLGNLEGSLADYKKAQELDAGNIEYYESSLTVRTKLEDYGGLIGDYNKILELDPENTEAFYMRGYYKLFIDDYETALEDFNNAIKLDAKLGKAYYYRGLVYARSKSLVNAANDFNKAATLDFKSDEAFFNEGLAYLEQNKPKFAQKAFSNSLKANPNGIKAIEARQNLGSVELMQNNFNKAIAIYNDILSSDPNNQIALFNRAYANGTIKNFDQAISDLTKCINLGYSNADVYYLRAAYYVSQNKFAEGCKDALKAKELGHPRSEEFIKTYCTN